MTVDQFVQRLEEHGWKGRRQGTGYRYQCPAHGGQDLNLAVDAGASGGVVCKCHSHGCSGPEVAAAIGLSAADLMPAASKLNGQSPERRVVKRYRYNDAAGELVFEVWRYEPKTFRPQHLSPTGEWTAGDPPGVLLPLYRLPELLAADAAEPVFICAGEKDADRLAGLGLVATTNPHGEEVHWRRHPHWLESLQGRRCIILEDFDPVNAKTRRRPGEEHGKEVFAALTEAGIEAKRLLLPGLVEGQDVSDWLNAGHTAAELLELAKPPPSAMAARVLSGKALLATELPSADWIARGMVARRMVQLIAGREKTGKSVLVETLCLAAAAGGIWIGEDCLPTRTLYINWEDPLQITQERLLKHLAPGEEPPEDYYVYPPPYTQSIWDLLPDLKKLIEEMNLGLIVIDPIARAAKWKDENDASETAQVFEALQELADGTGCGFVPVHHANKGAGQFGDVLRGSTAIPAGVIGFSVLRRTKNRAEFEFETIHKMGGGEDVIRVLKRDRETMTWQLVRTRDASEDDEEVSAGEQMRLDVIGIIGEQPGIIAARLMEYTGLSQSGMSRLLRGLKAERIVREERIMDVAGGRRPMGYWLTSR